MIHVNQIRRWKANNIWFIIIQHIKHKSGVEMYKIRYLHDCSTSYPSPRAIMKDSEEFNEQGQGRNQSNKNVDSE